MEVQEISNKDIEEQGTEVVQGFHLDCFSMEEYQRFLRDCKEM